MTVFPTEILANKKNRRTLILIYHFMWDPDYRQTVACILSPFAEAIDGCLNCV